MLRGAGQAAAAAATTVAVCCLFAETEKTAALMSLTTDSEISRLKAVEMGENFDSILFNILDLTRT